MSTKNPPVVVSTRRPLGYYQWGNNCEAWSLVENGTVSVKAEKMAPGSEEQLHFHNHSHQFFYIIKGRALFEVDDVILVLHAGDGLEVDPGRRHRIINKETAEDLEFLVYSQPSTQNDRENLV